MAKKLSSSLIGNYYSSMLFNNSVDKLMRYVRDEIPKLKDCRADAFAPGAIYALSKVLENEKQSSLIDFNLYDSEVLYWKEEYDKWFLRFKRSYEDADEFKKRSDEAFKKILDASREGPKDYWVGYAAEREIPLKFINESEFNSIKELVMDKHNCDIQDYIKQCFDQLKGKEKKVDVISTEDKKTPVIVDFLNTKIFKNEEGKVYSLILEDIDVLQTTENINDDICITGYDLESAVKSYFEQNNEAVLTKIKFDSESSAFCVVTSEVENLSKVTEVLYKFYEDKQFLQELIED